MPQFDTFIFSSSLFYFIISFFVLLSFNFTRFLPRISAILKLRHKIVKKSVKSNELVLTYHDTTAIFAKDLIGNDKN